jgi:FixJ family two-component response regulator
MEHRASGGKRVVHVVEDEKEVSDAIALLLSTSEIETASYASAEAFVLADGEREAACVLLDNNLPGLSGLGLLKRLRENGSNASVIIVTGRGDVPTAVAAMKLGAFHFLEKPFDPDELLALVEEGLSRSADTKPSDVDAVAFRRSLGELSEREREVYELMIAGAPTKQMAHELSISVRTAEHHRAAVLRKMGMRGLSHLIRAAMTVKNL